jgi:hypothetical protein
MEFASSIDRKEIEYDALGSYGPCQLVAGGGGLCHNLQVFFPPARTSGKPDYRGQSYQWTARHHEDTDHHGSTETLASSVEPRAEAQHQKMEESASGTKDADHHQHKENEAREPKTAETQQRVSDNFESQLAQFLQGYFETVEALAADDFRTAKQKMELMQSRLKQVDPKLLEEAKREPWKQIYESADRSVQQFLNAPNIDSARTVFEPISEQMEKAVRTYGSGGLTPVYRLHCPMAFGNRGAYWLQPREQVNNENECCAAAPLRTRS